MTDPNIVQRINAHFHRSGGTFTVKMSTDPNMKADFGTIYAVENTRVLYATTATWNEQTSLIAQRGYIYIYCDWKKDSEDKDIAGFKVGDGKSYLLQLPFTDQELYLHIDDVIRHVTQEERERWNNKERMYVINKEMIFTKD